MKNVPLFLIGASLILSKMESMIESTKDIIRTTTCTMNGAIKTT
jgi:hypothetical protein